MILPARRAVLALWATVFLGFPQPAHSQLGNLIKKKVEKASGQPAAQAGAEPVVFNDVVLELTVERIDKLLEAKRAGKLIADGPNGPAALREKMDALDVRQATLYDKYGKEIGAYDERRRAVANCRDSAYSALQDRNSPERNPALMQKMMQLGQTMAMAQARGDTASFRKVMAEMEHLKDPTAADSAAVIRHCGDATPTGVVKEWMTLKDQVEDFQKRIQNSEQAIETTESTTSGMNARQRGMACERIKRLIAQLKQKQAWTGFSDREIEAFNKREQAIKDLEELCP